jgi:hypothetical protein
MAHFGSAFIFWVVLIQREVNCVIKFEVAIVVTETFGAHANTEFIKGFEVEATIYS